MQRKWLKIVGILELLITAILTAVFCILLIGIIVKDNQRDGINYVIFVLMVLCPIVLLGFAMGMTAYRNHESAIVMQILGIFLLIAIPFLLLI